MRHWLPTGACWINSIQAKSRDESPGSAYKPRISLDSMGPGAGQGLSRATARADSVPGSRGLSPTPIDCVASIAQLPSPPLDACLTYGLRLAVPSGLRTHTFQLRALELRL